MINDIRLAIRMLRNSPTYTAVAVLSLGLSIGAGTAIFSLVNAVLLGSLPVPNPHELRVIEWSGADFKTAYDGYMADDGPGRKKGNAFSYPVFLALREQCAARADIFGYAPLSGVTLRARHEAVSAEGLMVSDNFFSGLGVRPLLGRLLGPEDENAGAAPTVVISYRCWEQQFDLDPNAPGQSVTVSGHTYTVVGVLPREFPGVHPGAETEFYLSLSLAATAPKRWQAPLMARLKPGVNDAQFRAALDVAFTRETATIMKQPKVLLTPGRAGPGTDRRRYQVPLVLLLGVVGVVLLVACANLAGLSLARGAARQHEFAVRAALGAARWRLVRQSLMESVLVALLGGGLGTLIALWGKSAISRLLTGAPEGLHYDTSLDLRVLGFTLAASLLAALLSGLLPALRAASVDPRAGLKDRAALGTNRLRAGRVLVAAQIALSLLLVAGAGLYVQTLVNLVRVNPGFAMENLLLFKLDPGNSGYEDARSSVLFDRVQQSLAAIPGVRSAALTQFPLLSGAAWNSSFVIPGHPSEGGGESEAHVLTVSETFFTTLGIPVLLGRELRSADAGNAPKVVVVNEAFVHKYFPGENPLGQTLKRNEADWRIVGVCRDIKYTDIKSASPPTVYLSFRQFANGSAFFVLRTALPPLAVVTAVRKVLAAVDPNIPLTDLGTQVEVRDRTISQERMFATLCGSLASLAVLLSCIGLYGLMAYHVARRTGEIGIRLALGATRGQIAGPIVREALVLAGAGVALGVPLILALTKLIASNLYGVKPSDPITLGAAVLLLLAVVLIAAVLPARRATKVDPMEALRHE